MEERERGEYRVCVYVCMYVGREVGGIGREREREREEKSGN